jgi:hypothetical protein
MFSRRYKLLSLKVTGTSPPFCNYTFELDVGFLRSITSFQSGELFCIRGAVLHALSRVLLRSL